MNSYKLAAQEGFCYSYTVSMVYGWTYTQDVW